MEYLTGNEDQRAIEWMHAAAKVAEQALCKRAKCGTVIVRDGKILGSGYNAPPLNDEANRTCARELQPGKPKYDQTCCVHAEWRAIIHALKNDPQLIVGSTLYFTRVDNTGAVIKSGQPYCTVCSRLALDVGIKTFVLWHEEGICEYPTSEYNQLSYNYRGAK